ncbi:hypothetical protein ACMDCO_03950 [Aerococcus urinaeequi]|uniref:hypothetical protein n=1 Tax=Aerococcus urinaeequi TaxID=51665 RepID=UPI0039BD2D7D
MVESFFKEDLNKESIITNWIINNFYDENQMYDDNKKIIKVEDLSQQHQGIDFVIRDLDIFGDNKSHNVDCKVAANYIMPIKDDSGNRPESIPTFSFELSYYMNQELKRGWLFSDKYSGTEYFMLGWVWADLPWYRDDKGYIRVKDSNFKHGDISEIEIMLIKKSDVQNFAENFDINKENFLEKSIEFRSLEENSKFVKSENGNAKFVYSYYLKEKPVNLLFYKKNLEKIAKYHRVIKAKPSV